MSKLGYFDSVLTDQGVPIAATITVFDQGTATPSSIFEDVDGLVPLANPFSTDALGRFQFFADGGTYDVQVSGAGITTYKIENVSLALTGPAGATGPIDGIAPEDYGAVGDGVTDDYQAFVDMFDDLKSGGAYVGGVRRKIILNPEAYYRISSRTDVTNVFLVPETPGLSMVGPGKEVQTFTYDGPAAVNFFNFAGGNQAVELEDMYISGGEGTDLNNYPITNIIYFDNVNYCTLDNVTLDRYTGKGVAGFNWYTRISHVEATRGDVGIGNVSTTVLCEHVYANNCRVGFEVDCWYGTYMSCACDWADVMFDLQEPWSVAIIGCGCEKVLQPMSGRALTLSVQGFTFDQTDIYGEFTFTSGGTYEIVPGDTITGAVSGETAVVSRVHVESGSWAGGDAAGTIRVSAAPSGAFGAENVNVGAEANVATLAGDIADRESSFALDQTKGRITGLYGKCETAYWFDCNDTCPDLTIDEPDSFTGSFKSLIKDYASPSYIMLPQVTGYPYNKGYDQEVKALSLFATVHGVDLSHHNARMTHEVLYADGTLTLTATLTMQKIHGNGTLIFRNENTVQGPVVTFNPTTGVGMSLQDIDVPIVFRNMYFKLSQDTYMFQIRRCKLVIFENCKMENTSGAGGYPFDIDEYSKVILDKDTMDDMVTATWNGLDNGRLWYTIEFRDFTAAPIAGLFDTGHRIWFQTPSAGAYLGCACTSGGVSGTWKGLGLVEA